jgi:glucose/arabinose dehydrogenase
MKIKHLLLLLTLSISGLLSAQSYTQTTIVTGMQYPVAFDFLPDGRIYATWKGDNLTPASPGTAVIKAYTATGSLIGTFYDLSDSVNADFERGLLGIATDPDFTNNHYIYVYYNHIWNGDERIRIVRFTESNNLGTQPTIIFDLDVSNSIPGNHVGGNLHFRPSDPTHIYFTIGDLAYQQTNPSLNYANKLTNPYGKHLRISSSPLAPPPTDNPYYDDGNPLTGDCDWIWSYGHRNPFDFCFSPLNDSLYSSENGLNTWDEMNQIQRGGFYGWADCEGFYINSSTTTPCAANGHLDPIEDWGSPVPALTGIMYYSGQVMPEFDNHVLVADNDYGRVYDITLANPPAYDQFVSRVQWMDMTTSGGLTTIRQGTDGCVWAMKGGYTTNGQIYRVCPQGLGEPDFVNPYFALQQNAPNPFTTTTNLNYTMKQNAQVRIVLYDIFGREVAVLADENQAAGQHQLQIDAQKLGLAPGNYFCSMSSGNAMQSIKISVIQ